MSPPRSPGAWSDPRGLQGLPAPALLAGAGLGAIVAIFLLATAVRSSASIAALEEEASAEPSASAASSDAPAAPPPSRTAAPAELDAARAGGLPALGPLVQRYPTDPAALRALMLAHAADKSGYGAAVGVARRLVELAPQTIADDDVRRVVVLAANGPPDVAAQAFEVVTAKMGAAGPDLLWELSTSPSSSKLAKDRASKLLEDPDERRLASPALLVALELRAALPCARKPLLARAIAEGDARALASLRPLVVTKGCGIFRQQDCYSCLGDRSELRQAISTLESRPSKK